MPIAEGSHVFEHASDTVEYEGWAIRKAAATSASVWRIKKINYDANFNLASEQWADGNELYDNEWDERAGLVYS